MKAIVTIVDFGMGNLFSVTRAFEYCGAKVILTDKPKEVEQAEKLVLPGVGAFINGMAGLRQRKLIDAVKKFTASGRPMLGICVGMQMMMGKSEEHGETEGLALIPGDVIEIPKTGINGQTHKIPHTGWNELVVPPGKSWDGTILNGLSKELFVYFVHSFTAMPAQKEHRLADCNYNGLVISAAIQSKNIYGVQFHPEKSGPVGLKIVENFIKIP